MTGFLNRSILAVVCWAALLVLVPSVQAQEGLRVVKPELPPGRPDNRVRFCGFGGDDALLEGLSKWWPNLDYCRAYDAGKVSQMTALAAEAKKRGIRFTLQAAGPVMPEGYLDKYGAWAVDFLNRKPSELGFSHPAADYCHPATVAAMKQNLETAFREVKASSLSMVDFVWPWVGGQWGYTEACYAAYRAALAEADGGLRLNDGKGGVQVMFFWEYLKELGGVRLVPRDLDLADWNAFKPDRPNEVGDKPTDAQRRKAFVFRGLYHWCWLKYAQESGAYARSMDGELQASLNPENAGNGTDLLMWGRLADTGEPWLEQWGNPINAITGFHTYRYFAESIRNAGKRLGLIAETGAAGGHPDSGFGPARPHYWDANSNYIISWALAAAGRFDDREEDYIWASMGETLDPAGPFYDCWRGYVKGMDGFWQYALDAPSRPTTPILSVVNRSILHSTDTSEQSVRQKFSLAPALEDLHIDFEQGYFPLGDSMLKDRKVLLFCPWDYPEGTLARLASWLEADYQRILVTHSFVPTRPCRGLYTEPVPELDDPAAAAPLGLTGLRPTQIRSGKIGRVAAEWAGLFALKTGEEVKFHRPLTACQGVPLVALEDGSPLVTRATTQNGGTVIYLNFCAPERYDGKDPDDSPRVLRAVLGAVTRQQGILPMAEGSKDWACARYDLDDGHAFVLIDRTRARGQERFTEETPLLDPAAKISLKLKARVTYDIYDVSAEATSRRQSDDRGNLELFLSGKAIRFLYIRESRPVPTLHFTTCERRDTEPRTTLPASLHAHRPGRAVITGLTAEAEVFVDGVKAPLMHTSHGWYRTVLIPEGTHRLEVR